MVSLLSQSLTLVLFYISKISCLSVNLQLNLFSLKSNNFLISRLYGHLVCNTEELQLKDLKYAKKNAFGKKLLRISSLHIRRLSILFIRNKCSYHPLFIHIGRTFSFTHGRTQGDGS